MVDFNEFSSKFVKENRVLKLGLAISLILNGTILTLVLLQKQYFVYQGGPIFKERPLAEDVCLSGFMSILNGNPNEHEVSQAIIKLVEDEPFTMTLDKLYQVKSLEAGICKIIFKADGRLQAYKIILNSSDKNPLFYKLAEIEELTITKESL